MPGAFKFNPITGKLDLVYDASTLAGDFVNVTGDTMTGALVITPTSGLTALTSNLNIVLKSGYKMIFDGA